MAAETHTFFAIAFEENLSLIVEALFTRTAALVSRLETRGTVSVRTRPLHRFIVVELVLSLLRLS